jgi:hypothetical protein
MKMEFSFGCFYFKTVGEKTAFMKQDVSVIKICCHFGVRLVFTIICLEYLQFGGLVRCKLLPDCSYGQSERCVSYRNSRDICRPRNVSNTYLNTFVIL